MPIKRYKGLRTNTKHMNKTYEQINGYVAVAVAVAVNPPKDVWAHSPFEPRHGTCVFRAGFRSFDQYSCQVFHTVHGAKAFPIGSLSATTHLI